MLERKEFADRLNHIRSFRNISARDLSISLGKSHGYINSIENCKITPSLDSFFLICDYLALTPAEFFDDRAPAPYTTKLLVERIKRLDEEQLQHVAAIVDSFSKNK